MKTLAVLLIALALGACTRTETVLVRPQVPPELLADVPEDQLPVFVAPATPGVAACLMPPEVTKLRVLAARLRAERAALRAWAATGADQRGDVKVESAR